MTYRFWNRDEAENRLDLLRMKIRVEEDCLSDFRRAEAIYLALSNDEREELLALSTLLAYHNYPQKRREQKMLVHDKDEGAPDCPDRAPQPTDDRR